MKKNDFHVEEVIRLGTDLSSDLMEIRFDNGNIYVAVRNGKFTVIDIGTRKHIRSYEICESTCWDFLIEGRLLAGNVRGELIAADTRDMRVTQKIQLCKKNIYSVALDNGVIYTTSQDMSVKAVDAKTFEPVAEAKKAVRGMARILGIHKDTLYVADTNKISLWDKHTLGFVENLDLPTGSFNSGAFLANNCLLGSDFHGVYRINLD